MPYFGAHAMWNYALGDVYYGENVHNGAFYPPRYVSSDQDRVPTGPTPYYYGCSFIASSAYWDPRTRIGPDQWRATSLADVVFPAQKLLLVSQYPMKLHLPGVISRSVTANTKTEAAAVDGSADQIKLGEIQMGVPSGDGGPWPGAMHSIEWPYGLHTLRGVAGIDRR
ncbi:MAG: hypothetical protein ACF8R7_11410 [Phycisphaerales bacterium JB039]